MAVLKRSRSTAVALTLLGLLSLPLALPVHAAGAYQQATGKAKYAMVLFIDGGHPEQMTPDVMPNLAALAQIGTSYSSARIGFPSDSAPGILGPFAGAPPTVTGIVYDSYYDRQAGMSIDLSETIAVPAGTKPHDQVRVPTLFDAAKAAGLRTAFISKHAGYELLQGPSGKAIDDLQLPELADWKGSQHDYDAQNWDLLRSQIKSANRPNLFGMYVVAPGGAEKKPGGVTNPTVKDELRAADDQLGRTIQALLDAGIYDDTVIVVTSDHGQTDSPAIVPQSGDGSIKAFLEGKGIGVAHTTPDDLYMVYLKDPAQADAAMKLLSSPDVMKTFGIQRLIGPAELQQLGAAPAGRTPDFVVIPTEGVMYAKKGAKKTAEHGGISDADRNAPLVIAGPGVAAGVTISSPVQVIQIGPTLAKLLNLSLPTATVPPLPANTAVLPNTGGSSPLLALLGALALGGGVLLSRRKLTNRR